MNQGPEDDSEARLIQLALRLEQQLAGDPRGSAAIEPSVAQLTPEELDELQRAGHALDFLHRMRRNLNVLIDDSPASSPEPVGSPENETAANLQGEATPGVRSELAEPIPTEAPKTLGRFEVLDVLGQGGFARVFLARDPHLDRLVALKVPLPNTIADDSARRRFEREARAAAVLSHPAIIPIYETGSIGPVSYIAFGYCPGQDLRRWFSEEQRSISPRTAASIVARLAEATEHAHQRGIVHRDLKPANVLLEMNCDEVASQDSTKFSRAIADRIRITDFGLARLESGRDETLTIEGSIVGTPAYMSPEQARGEGDVGTSSDIYSLGTILYELLTGELPFRRETHLATLRAIEDEQPPPPRRIKPTVPKDLAAICQQCLRKSKSDRYPTAHDLAADLDRWLEGVPVRARPTSSLEKVIAWRRRNPTLAAVTILAIGAVLAGLAGTTWQWRQAVANARLANEATQQANAAKEEAVEANADSEAFTNFLVNRVLAAARPVGQGDGLGKDVTLMEAMDAIEPTIAEAFAGRPRVEAKARNTFGATWRMVGELEKAAAQFQSVMQLKDDIGELDEQTLQSALELASVLFGEGKYNQAVQMLSVTHEQAEKALGPSHMLTFGCLNNLATILSYQDDLEAATPLFERLLEIAVAENGKNHPLTQKVRGNLAVAYRRGGNPTAALELLSVQFKRQQETLGDKNYETLRTMAELADTYTQLNQPELGRPLLERAVPIARELLGPDHPKTIDILRFAAANLQALGDMDAAVEMHHESIQLCQAKYGDYHGKTNECIIALADSYLAEQDFEHAEKTLSDLSSAHRAHENLTAELALVANRAHMLSQLDRTDDAIQLVLRYLPQAIDVLGEVHPVTLAIRGALADGYLATGQVAAAEDAYRHLIAHKRTTPLQTSESKSELAAWLAGHAQCLNQLQQFTEAESRARESLSIREATADNSWQTAESRSILGASQLGLAQLDQAREALTRAHPVLQSWHDNNHTIRSRNRLKQSMARLVQLYQKLDQPTAAAAWEKRLAELQSACG